MDIPLLNKEDVEKEGEDLEPIRDGIVEFLKCKGYRYAPSEDDFGDESNDFFTKGDQMIQVIINNEIPEEILDQIAKEEIEKSTTLP